MVLCGLSTGESVRIRFNHNLCDSGPSFFQITVIFVITQQSKADNIVLISTKYLLSRFSVGF